MIGHLGPRISALLDGQLPPEESERAWAHVHECHFCRDQVEREGWVKTRLAGLSHGAGTAPDHLKGSLVGSPMTGPAPLGHPVGNPVGTAPRRSAGLVAIGGSALGAAVVGVLVLGAAPGSSPSNERRAPVSHLVGPRTVLPTSYDVGLPRSARPTP